MDTTLTLTTDMELVLGLVVFTMVMFLFERIRADVVALVVLVVLGLTGLVPREDLFGGFAGNAVMSIIATMILGAGLDRTGALNRLAGWLLRRAHGVESRLLLLTTATAGLTSSIMQNPSVMSPASARDGTQPGLGGRPGAFRPG
jgi:di/tricarboxylate transporter